MLEPKWHKSSHPPPKQTVSYRKLVPAFSYTRRLQPNGVAWQGPGLSPSLLINAKKIVSAEVEVGDGRHGVQISFNDLAKTKHDLATVQFGAFLDEEMLI